EGTSPSDVRVIDAGGSTIVPGMVDAHSHVTLPGGSHWIDRGADPPEELLEVAEHNGNLLGRAGVRWARDVGSPLAVDRRERRGRSPAIPVSGSAHGSGSMRGSMPSNTDSSLTRTRLQRWPVKGRSS